jgi:hypothetical protein
MPEVSSSKTPKVCGTARPAIETANQSGGLPMKLVTRRPQSLLALNALALWVLALAALLCTLGFHYYGWGKGSSVGSSRFEVRVTVPPAPEALDEHDTPVMHTVLDLGGVCYGVAILFSLLGLLLAAVALVVPKRRRPLALNQARFPGPRGERF